MPKFHEISSFVWVGLEWLNRPSFDLKEMQGKSSGFFSDNQFNIRLLIRRMLWNKASLLRHIFVGCATMGHWLIYHHKMSQKLTD
jgi:hypothetical protein